MLEQYCFRNPTLINSPLVEKIYNVSILEKHKRSPSGSHVMMKYTVLFFHGQHRMAEKVSFFLLFCTSLLVPVLQEKIRQKTFQYGKINQEWPEI